MAIVTRQARKADFETLLKPTIRASSYISVNEPLAIAVYNGSVFEFDEGGIVRPTGIQSEEAFGSPQVKYNQPIFPSGIASEEAFGAAVLNAWIQPTGIPSAEAFGTPQVPQVIICGGIASGEAWGSPVLRYDQHITATGISSGELFGNALFKWLRTEMLPSAPGLRFGLKKLPEKGGFKVGMKSVFGLKPIVAADGCTISFTIVARSEDGQAWAPDPLDYRMGSSPFDQLVFELYLDESEDPPELCGKNVVWTYDFPEGIEYEIVTVDNNHATIIITATAEGTFSVNATCGTFVATSTVNVTLAASSRIVDTFTDADSTMLLDHESDIGGYWDSGGTAFIMDNAVVTGSATHTTTASSLDCYAEVTLIAPNGLSPSVVDMSLSINNHGGDGDGDVLYVSADSAGVDEVWLNGVSMGTFEHSESSVYKIVRLGSIVKAFRDSPTEIGQTAAVGTGNNYSIMIGNPFAVGYRLDNYNADIVIPT